MRVAVAAAVATVVAKRGVKKKSLSVAGARAAFAVGFVSLALSYRFGLTLIAFYYTSSRLTKWRAEEKQKLEADFEKESQRGVAQVRFVFGFTGRCCACVRVCWDACSSLLTEPLGFLQVLSSSIVGCVIAACYAAHAGADAALSFRDDWLGAWLLAAYLGHYACCAGDTWASEVLSFSDVDRFCTFASAQADRWLRLLLTRKRF